MLEGEFHLQWVFRDGLVDIAVITLVQRRATFHQGIEAEYDIFGANRMAIAELRFRAQVKPHPAVIRGFLDFPGNQAVGRKRLVEGLPGQGIEGQINVVGWHAFIDKRVEAVKAAQRRLAKGTALGGLRVDVVDMLEVGRIFRRLVIEGQGMLGSGHGRAGKTGKQQAGKGL